MRSERNFIIIVVWMQGIERPSPPLVLHPLPDVIFKPSPPAYGAVLRCGVVDPRHHRFPRLCSTRHRRGIVSRVDARRLDDVTKFTVAALADYLDPHAPDFRVNNRMLPIFTQAYSHHGDRPVAINHFCLLPCCLLSAPPSRRRAWPLRLWVSLWVQCEPVC